MTKLKITRTAKALAVIIFLIACLHMESYAQVLPALQNNFTSFQKAALQEKLYVHTNKNFYITGEILWFKIYNTDGATNKLLGLSKVAYIEILDNKHVPVLQAKIALNNGMGNGSFYLPFSLSNGAYQLRAYTNWMKNFGADCFFDKQITIVNTVKASPQQSKPIASDYDFQFFPEGGHLVKGLASKIAFKITASDGKGRDCSGVIINQHNDTVARFKSLKFGIGSFSFTPAAQTGYKAIIKVGSDKITKDIPAISESGYVLQATDKNDNWDITVQHAGDTKAAELYLFAHNQHVIEQALKGGLSNATAHFIINKDKLTDGISTLTLFDDQQRPLCERVIFKRPDKKLVIKTNTNEQVYHTRDEVSLGIATLDQNNKSIAANLSVSVFRLDSMQHNGDAHILSYLWLKADLKGHIESPDYYLDNNDPESNEALDNLLLSQGWSQFDWSKILAGEKRRFKFLPEYTGHIIKATILNNQTSQPAADTIAYLTILGSHQQLYVAKSDSNGQLLFNTKNFYGANELFVQTRSQEENKYRIDVANPFSEQYDAHILPSLNLNAGIRNMLIKSSVDMQAQNIFLSKQLKHFNNPLTDSVMFYEKPDYTYLLDDYVRFPTFEDVIHEYVRLVYITRNNGKLGLEISDGKVMALGPRPLVLIDSRPIFDINRIFSVDPLKIKRLDVIATNYVYGTDVFNGVLNFITYNNQSSNIELDPQTMVLDYEGLQQERKFYSPVYDSDQQINSTIPDFRSVLYWNPQTGTDSQGQHKLSFYTSDRPGKYIGIIEGIAPNGEAGSQYFYFEVRK